MTIRVQQIIQADCLLCFRGFSDPEGENLSFETYSELSEALNRRDWFVNIYRDYVLCSTCRHGNLMPMACQEPGTTWSLHTSQLLECEHRESGGVKCEVLGNHEVHQVGNHTISHRQWGNGFPCFGVI